LVIILLMMWQFAAGQSTLSGREGVWSRFNPDHEARHLDKARCGIIRQFDLKHPLRETRLERLGARRSGIRVAGLRGGKSIGMNHRGGWLPRHIYPAMRCASTVELPENTRHSGRPDSGDSHSGAETGSTMPCRNILTPTGRHEAAQWSSSLWCAKRTKRGVAVEVIDISRRGEPATGEPSVAAPTMVTSPLRLVRPAQPGRVPVPRAGDAA